MLQEYFDKLKNVNFFSSSLFDSDTVLKQSKIFALHPVVRELHAYVLDDENTSNHHLLVTAEPLSGSIFFLSHDGESRVVFECAADFLNAVRDAESQGVSVSDLHTDLSPVVSNQTALSQFIKTLLERRECDELVVSLVPSLDLKDFPLLRLLVSNADFFLGEAVAMEIEKRPSIALFPIAISCAEHLHPQVSNAGLRAVQCIQKLL